MQPNTSTKTNETDPRSLENTTLVEGHTPTCLDNDIVLPASINEQSQGDQTPVDATLIGSLAVPTSDETQQTQDMTTVAHNQSDESQTNHDEETTKGNQEETPLSDFDQFMAQYDDNHRPPPKELEQLAETICKNSLGPSLYPRQSSEENEPFDEKTYDCKISELGILAEWFNDVFAKLPEIQAMLAYGCRMWFVREYGIKEMMKRRGIFGGSLMDNLPAFLRTGAQDFTPPTAKATRFISFTGAYKLQHFLDLLRDEQLHGQYLWIDSFCVDQFAWARLSAKSEYKQNFITALQAHVKQVNSTALLLGKWDRAMDPLEKIWVLWEIFCTAVGGGDLKLMFHPDEYENFIQGHLMRGTPDDLGILSRIDVENATSLHNDDKNIIITLMKQQERLSQINSLVCAKMTDWMIQVGEDRLCNLNQQSQSIANTLLQNNLAGLLSNTGRSRAPV